MSYKVNEIPEEALDAKFICLIQYNEGVWSFAGCRNSERQSKAFVKWTNSNGYIGTYCRRDEIEFNEVESKDKVYKFGGFTLVPDSNEYRVFDDGEYEGRFVGSVYHLLAMTAEEAENYIAKGL